MRRPWRGFVDTGWGNLISRGTGYGTVPRTPVCRTERGTDCLACFGPWAMTSLITGDPISSFGIWEYHPQYDNWSFIDLESDYGKSFSSQTTALAGYDFDCLMLPNQRIDCMELAVRVPWGLTSPKTTVLRHVIWDRNNFRYSGWINYRPATPPASAPSTLGCVSWGGDRLDCFAAGAPLIGAPLLHAWFAPPRFIASPHASRGSLGPNDLWVSTRKTTLHAWSAPVNLGATVNGPTSDMQPFISSDGKTLLFASDRPGGLGTLDIYMTTRTKLRVDDDDDDDDDDHDDDER